MAFSSLSPAVGPPFWASAWGNDRYGPFCTLTIGQQEQTFRWIRPGTFWMGSPEDEDGHLDRETRHEVTLTRGYWLADSPCTQGMWQELMGENPSHFKGELQRPVETVSWEDCQSFVQRMQELADQANDDNMAPARFALPTEAQWEYACRVGSQQAFCFGDNPQQLTEYGWFNANSNDSTQPVKQKRPNEWGLYDMHGNVWEWCHDWYAQYDGQPLIDPTGPAQGRFGWAAAAAGHPRRSPAVRPIATRTGRRSGPAAWASVWP